ncbi:MAG: hypothetical protein ABI823_13915 [Bryobacteraceae bacterium]
MKLLTLSEAESKRRKAVEFLHRIGDDDRAEEFEAMSPEEYAEHKGVEIVANPQRSQRMARGKTVAQLTAELDEANDQIDELQGKLDDIVGIVADDDDEADEEDEEDDEDDLD